MKTKKLILIMIFCLVLGACSQAQAPDMQDTVPVETEDQPKERIADDTAPAAATVSAKEVVDQEFCDTIGEGLAGMMGVSIPENYVNKGNEADIASCEYRDGQAKIYMIAELDCRWDIIADEKKQRIQFLDLRDGEALDIGDLAAFNQGQFNSYVRFTKNTCAGFVTIPAPRIKEFEPDVLKTAVITVAERMADEMP